MSPDTALLLELDILRNYVYMYLYIFMLLKIVKKRDHKFEKEQEVFNGGLGMEEKEGRNVIILCSKIFLGKMKFPSLIYPRHYDL